MLYPTEGLSGSKGNSKAAKELNKSATKVKLHYTGYCVAMSAIMLSKITLAVFP